MTVTESVRDALEMPAETVLSHLHPVGSFDLADHVVPTGREEVWRFTPLKRLRGIHNEASLEGRLVQIDAQPAPGVSAEAVGPRPRESRAPPGWCRPTG